MTHRRSTQDIDLGFGNYREQIEYPKVQVLVPKRTSEKQIYYCANCNGNLNWIEEGRKYICYKCAVSYHETDGRPLSSISNAIKPLQSSDPYDRIEPAIVSRKIDRRLQGERINKYVQVTGDIKKARVHVNGSPSLATEDVIRRELEGDFIYGY